MFPRPVGRAGSVGGRAGWAFSPLLHLCSAPPTAALRPHPLCRRPPPFFLLATAYEIRLRGVLKSR